MSEHSAGGAKMVIGGDGKACVGADPELFFPEGMRGETYRETVRRAKEVCFSGCRSLGECRAFGLDTEQEYGIWGGLTARERKRIIRKRVNRAEDEIGDPEDGRDETVIALLMDGVPVHGAGYVDRAHAAVRTFRTTNISRAATARRFAVSTDALRKWVRRAESGEELFNAEWLAQHPQPAGVQR